MSTVMHPRVFLDVHIGSEPAGRLVIELFTDKAPRTCENFRMLCVQSPPDLSYKFSLFHRVIDEFMVQGGDITKGDGTGGKSIYGDSFPVENLEWRSIDKEGLVCMGSRGDRTVNSQFWITLAPSSHMDGKDTVFGQVVSGQETLRRIAIVETDANDRPLEPVTVSNCGELERRKKLATGSTRSGISSHLEDRGRPGHRRSRSNRSTSHSHSSSALERHAEEAHARASPLGPSNGTRKRLRRRSDHSIDETLRGRVRRRSRGPSRTPSPIVEESRSPRRRERNRSREPSRSPHRHRLRSDDGYRRRPSLPNHYERWKKHSLHHEDEERLRLEELEREGGEGRYAGVLPDEGRLSGSGAFGTNFSGSGGGVEIKFKGRGSMKYRERKRY